MDNVVQVQMVIDILVDVEEPRKKKVKIVIKDLEVIVHQKNQTIKINIEKTCLVNLVNTV